MTHPPVPGLFPAAADRRRSEALLAAALDGLDRRIAAGPVAPTLDMSRFREELAEVDFAAPRALDALLPWVIESLERGVTQITHPRYFGLFNPAPTFPAQCADRIVAAFNPQLASATTSPAAVAMEAHVIRAVAARAGLPADAGGHFTSGGAEANATALTCALTVASPDFARLGARCFDGPPVFYISREAHLAWIKIAHQAGIGREAVRLVRTDGQGRLHAPSLADAIATDRAQGAVPFMVAATAGTTAAGMIDPLPDCAAIARDHGLWLHVDAAWGGAAIASPQRRGVLAGLELADSVTIDAHKWFATTMGCGMFLTRRPAVLSAAFQVSTGYMPSNSVSVDPYVNSIQWSRRFLGLRLFLALAAAGWDGYAAHVERAIGLAGLLARRLGSLGWRVANDSPLAVLCLEPPEGSADPATIVRRVLAAGTAWISVAMFEGRPVIRTCVTHGATAVEDVEKLVGALEAAR
ncbi:MAG TPA: pyridoxal-dependent decarboxylase [Rhodopila sp.]|uniref:pyridoxal phosphate-dependent decarboxylase family protein n=1 Tax=Rhodopila sp. TaxID=2480087 RepID=UPI002BAF9D12|nr:pyridoxal-dependent decarboxylase [Rhodopila sp.]HVY14537.1 pyridoxal-dependent decarboxylase [Rhodopila sp.]